MKLQQIELRQFRNIQHQSLSLQSGLNVFRGANGQGKTNLIEAIYLLTHGRSFRTNDNSALVQHGDYQGTSLTATIEKKGLSHDLAVKILAGRKKTSCHQKAISSAQLKKNFPSVLFSPESLLVVKESAQHRRALVDDLALAIFPSYSQFFDDCRKLLKQKNALLKQIRDGIIDRDKGHRLFHNVTELFFKKSAKVIHRRIQLIREILPIFQEEFSAIMGDSLLEIEMNYLISGQSALGMNEEEVLNALYNRFEQLKSKEYQLGISLIGPHKHDVQFIFNGQEARIFCSQGQQRAIILAFKMAHIRLHYAAHGVYPVLLLDDVLSELDRQKQDRFLDYLMATGSQIFLTTTDASTIPRNVEPSIYEVSVGQFIKKDGWSEEGLSV